MRDSFSFPPRMMMKMMSDDPMKERVPENLDNQLKAIHTTGSFGSECDMVIMTLVDTLSTVDCTSLQLEALVC